MLKYTIRAAIIVDEGSGGDPRGSPMELNVGVNGKNGKYPVLYGIAILYSCLLHGSFTM